MDIEQIKVEKENLEKDIFDLLVSFQKRTSVNVQKVNLYRHGVLRFGPNPGKEEILTRVSTKIEL